MALPASLASAIGNALLPLRAALDDPARFAFLLSQLGWQVELNADQLAVVNSVTGLGPALNTLAGGLDALDSPATSTGDAVGQILDAADAIYAALDALTAITPGQIASLPEPLDTPAFWAELAAALPTHLLLTGLQAHAPAGHAILDLLGLVEPDAPRQNPMLETPQAFRWDRLGPLLADPPGYLAGLYSWDDGGLSAPIVQALARLAAALGVPVTRSPLDDSLAERFFPDLPDYLRPEALDLLLVDAPAFRAGLRFFPVVTANEQGLYIGSFGWGSAEDSPLLGDGLHVEIENPLQAGGVFLAPGRSPTSVLPDAQPTLDRAFSLIYAPEEPRLLLGDPKGVRLQLVDGRLGLRFGGTPASPELIFEAGGESRGLELVLDAQNADAFLSELMGGVTIEASLTPEVTWSTRTGFDLGGGLGLEITVPLHLTLGPLTLFEIYLGLLAAGEGLDLTAAVTFSAKLPPVTFSADRIGLLAHLTPGDPDGGTFGGLEIDLAFKPPEGLGLAIDLVVGSGGGYLDYTPPDYAGVAELSIATLSLSAVGLISTVLDDGSTGWSAFLSINANFTPIQLGFGFTLNGIGGLVGLNRGLDVDALQDGVYDGSLDALMFPDDPVANAPFIVETMQRFFPVHEGQMVLGVMVQLGWGTPTLITANLGVILELPDPVRIVLLGQVACVLPVEELALIALHIDVVGIADLSAGTISIDGSLRDSYIINILLSGDMALRAGLLDDPTFLLSIGGFNPRFEAPADFPALRRLGVGLGMDLAYVMLECYVAVTSNTLQTGAGISFYASVAGFEVEGGLAIDVLIQFEPFGFTASMDCYVTISAGGHELAGVYFGGTLSGPNPWLVTGQAEFKFLGIKSSIDLTATLGDAEQIAALPHVDLLERLATEFRSAANWREYSLSLPGEAVSVADYPVPDGRLYVHPGGELEVRQSAAPLDRALDKFGEQELTGANSVSVTGVEIVTGKGGSPDSFDPVDDWFATAQFMDMTKLEKLAAPSFERMTAGVRFGDGGVETGAEIDTTLDYDTFTLEAQGPRKVTGRRAFALGPQTDALRGGAAARAQSAHAAQIFGAGRAATFGLVEPRFTLTDKNSGAPASGVNLSGLSYTQTRQALDARASADPAARTNLQIVPVEEGAAS